MTEGIFAIKAEKIKNHAAKAWAEVKPLADVLPRPRHGPLAPFFGTPECDTVLKMALDEYLQKPSTPEFRSHLRVSGHIAFPGVVATGQTTTILVPLQVIGEVNVGPVRIDLEHHYNILSLCDVEVSEGGKMVALVVSNIPAQ
ncbi:uncharacterized protein ASPGLDRAFT_46084 [Aspergillus glaucus CBS 516.65]|uniref:Uncharacterized protein n=1 Tax=Aspergillus glaucus CBS 516.65 TaxID=1160497 RepID=A0A1L9VML2_ASPGL|nr:hypothetical protein ASPGLDRAFT_46084 [Aspergillus glaucus CBS 516.65]OJJ85120.1 hypothetical protein ASPGLDRAFT_46084 [Aspergillus glaucus CBS 516.65]